MWFAKLDANNRVAHKSNAGRHAWVHLAEGEVKWNGKTLLGGDAAIVDSETTIELVGVKPSQVLLFDLN